MNFAVRPDGIYEGVLKDLPINGDSHTLFNLITKAWEKGHPAP